MRNVLLALALTLPLARPAAAQEEPMKIIPNKDLTLSFGYKLWLNNWSSWDSGYGTVGAPGGPHNFVAFSQGGVANNINLALKYKMFFTNLGFMIFPQYRFPRYDFNGSTFDQKATRNEIDWNVGIMAVPQLGFTVGLKNVTQKWSLSTNGGAYSTPTTWNWTGPTLGIVGGAALGHGFSLYGNGAGGIMWVTQNPQPVPARNDTANFESAEMGIGWRAMRLPLSASFGYKIQRINTKLDISGYQSLRGLDVTSGYTLGLNLLF